MTEPAPPAAPPGPPEAEDAPPVRHGAAWLAAGVALVSGLSLLFLGDLPARWLGRAADAPSAHFTARDVSADGLSGAFTLSDPAGRTRTLEEFRGRVVVLTFGYTNCPDFCPTTLAKLAEARRLLGAEGQRVQVLFVTVDPQRDSALLLGNYVPQFDPSFIGLRGPAAQTEALARALHAAYRLVEVEGQTQVEHTASSYVIDAQGRTRLVSPYDQTARSLADDLRTLLRAP
jgi:protein SCO1/2